MTQPGQYFQFFNISRDIEMRALQLNFRKRIFHRINTSLSSKLRFIDDNISFSFILDSSKSFETQIHKICSGVITADSSISLAVVAIQKAIHFHGEKLSNHIQEYLLSFLFNFDFKSEQLGKY